MKNRWLIYQQQRFPLLLHVPTAAIICLAALSYSSQLRGASGTFDFAAWWVALLNAVILFFQLRVADEIKDYDIDARYRSHRPVPSGLIKLRELELLAKFGALVQLISTALISPELLPLLFGVWAYLLLMTCEFFVSRWLNAHPTVYLLSHMLIVPLMVFYISAFDWLPQQAPPPVGIEKLLLFSFLAGVVAEVGRKIRAPENERTGVQTYTSDWGTKRAPIAWLLTTALLCAVAIGSATTAEAKPAMHIGAALILLSSLWISLAFVRRPKSSVDKLFQICSAASITFFYLQISPLTAISVNHFLNIN